MQGEGQGSVPNCDRSCPHDTSGSGLRVRVRIDVCAYWTDSRLTVRVRVRVEIRIKGGYFCFGMCACMC